MTPRSTGTAEARASAEARTSDDARASDAVVEPKADGRVLRGQRTRAAIVQALLDLITGGTRSPTAAQIAERAGVSVRSVFQHFEDLEALYADLAEEQGRRIQPLIDDLDPSGDLQQRIDAIVQQRRRFFETATPVRHAVMARASTSAAIERRLRHLNRLLRQQVSDQFASELSGGDDPQLLDTLDLLCSFESWDRLRTRQGLGAAAAAEVLRSALARTLD